MVILLVGFTACGAKRGLLRALAGLLIVAAALIGAGMIAATFSGPAARLAAPIISGRIAEQVDEAMAVQADGAQMPEADDDFRIEDLLALLGLDEDVRDSLAESARETVRDTGVSIATAVVESIAGSIIYGVLYILSFLALLVLLNVLVRAMDLLFKLPGLHGVNALGGGLLGLLQGALLLFLAVWAARRLGVSFETEPWAEAHILRIFTTHTPLSVLSFLQ
ncbi:MAG: CvpA family protein [Oscillospiraceae bacterium]|nr:CvpA family protein [Oscillospiraceae bacterium]